MQRLIGLTILALLTGCVSNQHRATEAAAFYAAQEGARKPLFELTALPGQTIELRGVQSLVVNDPRASEIKALPVVHSPIWNTVDKLLNIGGQYATVKAVGDTFTGVSRTIADSAGDRSTHDDHSTHIADSYNDSSDNSQHGDTISDSYNQDNDNTAGDGSAIGDGNSLINGDNAGNSGQIGDDNRQDSPNDDHSDPGDDCADSDCSVEVPTDPDPET
jgi:hypothetical protein